MTALHTFHCRLDDAVLLRVFAVKAGFAVTLFDGDSGETLPFIKTYPTELRAVAAARIAANLDAAEA
jgi:hypothetical protein